MNPEIARLLPTHPGTSLNAVAQALRRLPLSRSEFFKVMGIPRTRTSSARYWEQSYNIRPWGRRSKAERFHATWIAEEVLTSMVKKGFKSRKAMDHLAAHCREGADDAALAAAGCLLHHHASRMGYTPVDSIGRLVPYRGRFGTGYIRLCGRHRGSTTYESIAYYIFA